jgi:Domain of unknown function (DUF1929)
VSRKRNAGAAGACLLALAASSSAAAHGPPARTSDARIRAFETRVLGPQHAVEHARGRRSARRFRARLRRMSPATRRALARRERSRVRAAASVSPSEGGSWAAPFALPVIGIHAALLPTGKVMLWGYPFPADPPAASSEESKAWLWDPAKGTGAGAFNQADPPLGPNGKPIQIFCSGGSLLADGRLLTTGGNLRFPTDAAPGWAGIDRVYTFNPWNETWTRQPDMRQARWYPSQELLPDGRTVIISGWDGSGNETDNPDLEVFTPSEDPDGRGEIEHRATGDRSTSLYPHLFTLASGKVLLAGPDEKDAALLDTSTFTWAATPGSDWRRNSSSVLDPAGPAGSTHVTQIGGIDFENRDRVSGHAPPLDTTETIDGARPQLGWTAGPKLNFGRSTHNTVQLPDGSMVTVGGSNGENPRDGRHATWPDARSRQVELYDPVTKKWRLGPAQAEDRAYHSTAVLMPDGRVLSAGDDRPGTRTSDTGEVYSPPYLFKGARPAIASAPRTVDWATPFRISTASPDVSRAVLMAPGVTTHGEEMHAKHVELQIALRQEGSGLTVLSPPTSAVAQPGWYMLFLLDDEGVPSVAHWVRLQDGADADEDGIRDKLDGCPELRGAGPTGCPVDDASAAPNAPLTPAAPPVSKPQEKKTTPTPRSFGREAQVAAMIPSAGTTLSRSGVVSLALSNGNPFDVTASATLAAARPFAARRRRVRTLGSARAALPARRRAAVRFRLSRGIARALARRRLTRVTMRLVLRDPRGNERVVRSAFWLRPAARGSGSR